MSRNAGIWTLATTCCLFLAASCSSGSPTSNGGGGGGSGSISITISGATLTLTQGENGQVNVTLSRSGGFSGSVTLSAQGLPSGVTAGSSTIGSGSTTGSVQIDVSPTATPGTFTVTLRATGTGVSAATATFTLTINESGGGASPSISISLASSTLAITQGQNGQVNASLTRAGGFAGDVTLTAQGLPNGVTANSESVASGETSGTLQIDVSPTAMPGVYTVTIRAAGTGVSDATAPLTLTVNQASGGGGGNVTYSYCTQADLPDFFAYKDGNGPWMAAQPNGLSYSFDLSSGRGGVAWVDANGSADVQVFLGATSELGVLGGASCMGESPTKTVQGSVAGLGQQDQATISLGSATALVVGAGGNNNFTLNQVPEGVVDLVSSLSEFVINGMDVSIDLKKLIIRRDLNPADGSTLPVLDFGSAEAFDPETRNLTINNLGADMALASSLFFTSNLSSGGTFFTDFQLSSSTMRTFPTVPANRFQSGDLQLISVTTAGNPNSTSWRTVVAMSGAPVDQMVTLGPELNSVNLSTAATTPYVRPQIMYAVQPEYDGWFALSFSQDGGNGLLISATSGYLDGATSLDIVAPDFTGHAGWNPAWGLQAGAQTFWGFTATGWSGAQGLFNNPFADGVTWHTATTSDEFTP